MAKYNIKKIDTWAVSILGMGILLYVGLSIIFPSFTYFINKTDKYKVSILRKEFDEKKHLVITPLFDYPYQSIEAKISLGRVPEKKIDEFPVFYGFEAEFYPVRSGKISTQRELMSHLFFENSGKIPNGSLIASKDAVYFVSRGKARPFLGPEVFLRLGYDWKNVQQDEIGTVAQMGEDEKLNFTSAHPDGTILKFVSGEYFLVWEKTLVGIDGEVIAEMELERYSVEMQDQELRPAGKCQISKANSKSINCSLDGAKKFKSSGQTYLFEVPDDVFEKITDAKIKFDMLGNYDLKIAKETLKRIKDKLALRYGYELLK